MLVVRSRLNGRWLCFVNMTGHMCFSCSLPHELPDTVCKGAAVTKAPAAWLCFFDSPATCMFAFCMHAEGQGFNFISFSFSFAASWILCVFIFGRTLHVHTPGPC
mmetsp:Transcript_25755/g.76230  ORF Transcript_25755/g.76230 Transcript_25755/m.76230 type:complete len:105 (+) Transcript_25755:2828-3142(+)